MHQGQAGLLARLQRSSRIEGPFITFTMIVPSFPSFSFPLLHVCKSPFPCARRGHGFFSTNAQLLERYSRCNTAVEVIASQNEWLQQGGTGSSLHTTGLLFPGGGEAGRATAEASGSSGEGEEGEEGEVDEADYQRCVGGVLRATAACSPAPLPPPLFVEWLPPVLPLCATGLLIPRTRTPPAFEAAAPSTTFFAHVLSSSWQADEPRAAAHRLQRRRGEQRA